MIKLDNISAGYEKERILNSISFDIPKNQLISVVGPNGSGKSTLLKAIIGNIKASCGEIYVDDVRMSDLSRHEIAKKIAYLAQGKNIPDMTVLQMVLHGRFPHLGYPRRYKDKDYSIANAALRQMGILDMADKPVYALSGGMRQKAYIAMALAQDTDYILMDEPTTYLDIYHQIELMKILRRLADNGKGIVAVMHDLPLAFNFSDRIAVLRDGKIHMCDSPGNICDSKIIKDIFGIDLYYSLADSNYHYGYMAVKSREKL